MYKIKGFSLIELIVVITIVGLLSAIAIPVYKTYTDRAKISVGRVALESFEPVFLKYYASHDVFPEPEDVGLPPFTIPSNANDYLVPPYLVTVGMGSQATPGSCVFGNLYGYISNYTGGAFTDTNQNAPVIIYMNYYIDVKGMIIKKCMAYEMVNGDPTDRNNLVPGCVGYSDDEMQTITDIIDNACD